MKKDTFVERLRDLAKFLQPFTTPGTPGAKHWDGTAYVEDNDTHFEPQALAWWATLTAIAEMLDNQDGPPSEKQTAYLEVLLFGGMGSLNDLSISSHSGQNDVAAINGQLDRHRRLLFASFKE